MKKLIIFIALPLLVACGSNQSKEPAPSKSPSVSISIPNSCATSKVLEAIQDEIPGSAFIDTKWTPAPDTELFDFLNNGGIACSYGLASAEIGATVRWVDDKKSNFEKWLPTWIENGYQKVDLSEFGLREGYFLQKSQSETQEFNIWSLNFKANGVWVSISRTAGDSIGAGRNLIEAVLEG